MQSINPFDAAANATTTMMNNRNHIIHQRVLTAAARAPLTNCTTADKAAEAAVLHGIALSRHYEKTRPRHPPQDLARMIDDAFPTLPVDCQPRQLSPSEITAITSSLRNATVDRQRKEIVALRSQMAEHHALLDRLERLQEKYSALERAHDERCHLVEELEEQVAALSECCQRTADIEEEDREFLSSSSHHRPISRAESSTASGPTTDAESISSKVSDDDRPTFSPDQTLSAEATLRLRELYAMPPLRQRRKEHAPKSPRGSKMVGREGRGGGHGRAHDVHQAITPLVMPKAAPVSMSGVMPRVQGFATRSHHAHAPANGPSQLQAPSLVAQSSQQVHWHVQQMAPTTLSNPPPSYIIAPQQQMQQEGVPAGGESYAQAYVDFCTSNRQHQAFRFQNPHQDLVRAGKRQRLDDVGGIRLRHLV